MSSLRSFSLLVVLGLAACATAPAQHGPGAAVESIHNPPNAPPVPEDAPEGPPAISAEPGDAAPAAEDGGEGLPSDANGASVPADAPE